MFKSMCKYLALASMLGFLAGCATEPPKQLDYTAYKKSNPHSILVLPPISKATDVNAGNGVLAQVTYPLAEAGYYVLPVGLVSETFKQNGLTTADDIHQVPLAKLRQIFGADAVLYIEVSKYGVSYQVLDSVASVSVSARLVDLRSGATLWTGSAQASDAENNNNNNDLLVQLVSAAIKQIAKKVTDATYPVAGVADQRLLEPGRFNGILYGPRSPKYMAQ
ncbi:MULTISPECIES: DUF799 domain-containing protein [unclassified Paludibacterium]|uniref:DUF799 domain-containing protein n=1 Tax=unclassified Paludibacterium TaxID=2618429 RepID=UPI00207B8B31|nr:DUF799 domain-containing protein [Paludibacterium sp. B53371]BEV72155.1 DUF799 domain-containing protein [Paludibacterium sp. THUN1379]